VKLRANQQVRFKKYVERGIPLESLQSLVFDESPFPILQEDHVASRQHDSELVAPVSCKVHVPRLERNRDAAGINRKHESSRIKRVMWALRSTAVFLELLAEAMWRWSDLLERRK
jgi:hypothetical protein